MKKKFFWIALAFAVATQALALDISKLPPPLIKPQPQQAQAAHLAAEFLTRFHYKPLRLDQTMSEKIFDSYLKSLDVEKIFFVQSDVDQLAQARDRLDSAILREDLNIPFAIFNLYANRSAERYTYARALLKQGFDFKKTENYRYLRDKESWARTEDELRELWRQRVKNDWLRLRLAGKDDKSIADILDKRYERFMASLHKLNSDDVFQTFMNAYTTSIEPHTNYLGLRASEGFDIEMKLSLVGIGASLQEKDDYPTIRDLVPGGPAALSGKLKIGDRIVGIGQGGNGPVTEVLGWRIDDTVELIRGAAGSLVTLEVLPADAGPGEPHKLVTLSRKKISLEQQAAKKAIVDVADNGTTRHVGVITLPIFYQDFSARKKGDRDFKSATRDVSRLLSELKKDKVDSVLIDLRDNGGGSLNEAVELTGLFIGQGPVVQQRDARGKISVERNQKANMVWSGPLGVLINRGSASASEIFAAAIQDYGRGLVIGEPSFGKGTVQSLISLDAIAKNDKPKFGDLKMTVAQFFRINGGTTQLRGVTPDLSLPSGTDQENFGESSYGNALPWVQIKAADFKPAGNLKELLPLLQARHAARVAQDKDFQYLQEDIAEFNAQRKKGFISLNESERRAERDAQEARLKSRDAHHDGEKSADAKSAALTATALQDDGLQSSERNLTTELASEKAQKGAKDVLLSEAVQILGDELALLKLDAKLAARALPRYTFIASKKRE